MSVPTTLSNTTFTGIVDGVACDCLFPVENVDHLEVTYGADVVAVLGVDYNVALFAPAYDHATVTPIVGFAAKSGGTINAARKVPIVQTLAIPTLAEIASARLEQAFDYLTYIATYLRDQLTSSLKFPKTDDPTMNVGTLPGWADRAGKVLGFDALGKPSAVTVSTTGVQAFSVFGSAWALVASAANALTSLGFSAYTKSLIGIANLNDYLTALNITPFAQILVGQTDAALARATLGVYSTTEIANLFPRGLLAGFTLSTAGGTDTVGIAAGSAADSTNVDVIKRAAAFTKKTGAWVVGSGNGGLDTGAIANNTWYHVHLIKSNDGTIVDAVFSLSVAAPTLPAGYTAFRRIGSVKTDGAAHWIKLIQDGDLFRWDTVPAVYDSTANPGTAAILATLAVPTGVKVRARMLIKPVFATTGGALLYVNDPAVSSQTPANAATPLGIGSATSSTGGATTGVFYEERTNVSAQVQYKLSASGAADEVYISTLGWLDSRGRDD